MLKVVNHVWCSLLTIIGFRPQVSRDLLDQSLYAFEPFGTVRRMGDEILEIAGRNAEMLARSENDGKCRGGLLPSVDVPIGAILAGRRTGVSCFLALRAVGLPSKALNPFERVSIVPDRKMELPDRSKHFRTIQTICTKLIEAPQRCPSPRGTVNGLLLRRPRPSRRVLTSFEQLRILWFAVRREPIDVKELRQGAFDGGVV